MERDPPAVLSCRIIWLCYSTQPVAAVGRMKCHSATRKRQKRKGWRAGGRQRFSWLFVVVIIIVSEWVSEWTTDGRLKKRRAVPEARLCASRNPTRERFPSFSLLLLPSSLNYASIHSARHKIENPKKTKCLVACTNQLLLPLLYSQVRPYFFLSFFLFNFLRNCGVYAMTNEPFFSSTTSKMRHIASSPCFSIVETKHLKHLASGLHRFPIANK